jgi:hypothetical protein
MDTLSKNCAFDADDRKVYTSWLRGTVFAYGAIVLFGIAAVVVQDMTSTPNVAGFMTTAIVLASP